MSTISSDAGTTLPPTATAVQYVSSQPTSTSVPQTEPNPIANTPELETEGQAQDIDPTEASTTTSYPPVASVSTELTQDSSTALEDSLLTTISASTMLDPTPVPDATINPEPDDTENSKDVTTGPSSSLPDLQDPSTSVSPTAELDSLTTHVPSLTTQGDATDDVTPGETTADPLKVNPEPTNPQPSKPSSKPQVKPDPYKPLPTKPTLAKPASKPESKPLDTAQTLSVDDPRNYQAGKICF